MTATRAPRSSQALLDQLVLTVFSDDTARTRADVESATGLSRAVVTGVITQLVDAGELAVVDHAEQHTGRRGRPSTRYRRMALAAPVNLVQFDKGQVTRAAHIQHAGVTWADPDRLAPWSASWSEWSTSLSECLAGLQSDATGPAPSDLVIAAPFPVARGKGAPRLHRSRSAGAARQHDRGRPHIVIPDWLTSDPRARISNLTGQHVQLINDANLAALGEATAGVGAKDRSVLYVLVKDGVGAGLIIDGTIVDGAHGMTGELAHVQVADDGPFCLCGNTGCLATQTQDPRVIEVLSAQYTRPVTWCDVERLAASQDPLAVRVLRELGRLIGHALAATLTVLDLDAVILDGGLGAAAPPLIKGLRLELDHRCPPTIAGGIDIKLGQLAHPIVHGAWAAAQQRRHSARSRTRITFREPR